MSITAKYVSRLDELFRRKRAALLDDLRAALGTASRTTIFRILKAVGYCTSYNHAGRFYTLRHIPRFDRLGLWSWHGIGFSSHGTLRATSVFLIEQSEAGQTHEELQKELGLRVHDTLRSLVQEGIITRQRFEDLYVYLSADARKAVAQMAARQKLQTPSRAPVVPPDPLLVIDVLVEVIHHPREDAADIAARLRAGGRNVTPKQVEEVCHSYAVKKNGSITLAEIASLRRSIRELEQLCRQRSQSVAGALVDAEQPLERCLACGDATRVQKTWERTGATLQHGSFRLRQTVRVCVSGCREKRPMGTLATLIPPHSVIGYDVLVYVGLQRFLHYRQREEIRASLAADHGLSLSSGEISVLASRFLAYLQRLHHASSPALKAALAADGGWPLQIDATGEDGRGTLLVAFTGWRQWVLGAWKIPTERADAILPRLRETIFRFGSPCAIVRDLGRAMTEAADNLLKVFKLKIPVLACHLHFLSDIGKDLLAEGHDRLRALFRQTKLRSQLRTLARDLGRNIGQDIDRARAGLRAWQSQAVQEQRLPTGSAGVATVRALTQWILDYAADTQGDGFPFDLPWLALYDRCLQAVGALQAFLLDPPDDPAVRKALERLRRILHPIENDDPGFASVADRLTRRLGLFEELRKALRLREESNRRSRGMVHRHHTPTELRDIRSAVHRLSLSLKRRRPARGPAGAWRDAIDIVLSHLQKHGRFLWGHAIRLPQKVGGGIRLVDRTNNAVETYFHAMKHGERRRSGRKVLTQDFEKLSPAAALAMNLNHSDYVAIVCGSLDKLPEAFARLDYKMRRGATAPVSMISSTSDPETASLCSEDRKIVRSEEMTCRIIEAAQKTSKKRKVA